MNWVRSSEKPSKRRIVLIYDPTETKYKILEDFILAIPFRSGNQVLLDLLLHALLGKKDEGDGQPNSPGEAITQPTNTGFSAAARHLLDSYGENK